MGDEQHRRAAFLHRSPEQRDDLCRSVRVEIAGRLIGQDQPGAGDHGAGQITKACNQLALTVTAQAAAEALSLARSCGLDPARVHEALMGGVAASRVLELFGKRMVSRDFGSGIDARLYHKDLGIVLELAQEAGLPLPAGAVVKQQINALMGAGEGTADFSVLIRALERAAGQTIG